MPKRAYPLFLLFSGLLTTMVTASSAHAQGHAQMADPYFAAKLAFGLGGSATATREQGSTTTSQDQSLGVTFGVAGQYLHPLHDFFSLGGMLGIHTWRSTSDNDGGRNFVFDLAVLPQGKYVLMPNQLEINLGVPIGLGLDMWNEVDVNSTWVRFASGGSAGGAVEGDTAIGFVFGFLLGARYQLQESFGLLLELGYLYRTFGHSITTSTSASAGGGALFQTSNSTDVSVSFGQFQLNLGAYF